MHEKLQTLSNFEAAVRLPCFPSEREVFEVVERWVDALSDGQFHKAYDLTVHDAYYNWSPALMQLVIEGYGHPEPHPKGPFVVTSRKSALGVPRHEIDWWDEEQRSAIGEVWYDMPLNGRWSDVTTTFLLVQRDGACFLVLEQIHVF